MEEAALVASVVSVLLAFVAIWLAFRFYEMTAHQAETTDKASRVIETNVERINEVFSRLYQDVFTLFRQLVVENNGRSTSELSSLTRTDGDPATVTTRSRASRVQDPRQEVLLELLDEIGADERAVGLDELSSISTEIGIDWITPMIGLLDAGLVYDVGDQRFTTSSDVRDQAAEQQVAAMRKQLEPARQKLRARREKNS